MKNIIGAFKVYADKTGVQISLVVTFLSILMLVISLVGLQFDNEGLGTICFISLIIEFVYGVILSFNILRYKDQYFHLIPFLFLNWFIGCFCANVFINIFENLPLWVYLVTFLFCLSNFFIYNSQKKDDISATGCYFINGFSYLLIIYYMIYLIPFAPVSLLGILALGLGFYGLVPAIVFLSHTATLVKIFRNNKAKMIPFSAGILSVVIGLAVFALKLDSESSKLCKNSVTKSFEKRNEDLPTYISISQNLKPNFFNEILLKKDIVYVCVDNFFEFRGVNEFGSKQYNERKMHNPFINIAYLFSKNLNLNIDDRINILKSNFDKRLETEEQLWSGNDLFTQNIKEDVKIYAKDRLAYTEITMDIACDKDSWGEKEAIYSFQLPEGSVATSLSLWVNGIERKGVLTSKERAQKAYKEIVSVEARDPSLMQWKEGNKVVVRVFPISKDLPRTFKCGFSTPLNVEGGKMRYESLNIKGPNIYNAETVSRIQMVGDTEFTTDKDFELVNNYYINESTGLDKWEAIMPLKNEKNFNSFVWKDKVYEIKEIEKQTTAFSPKEIVLDLNSIWTLEEVEAFVKQTNKKYVVFINNEKQEISAENYDRLLPQFADLHYSLLPLYKLSMNSLVVTKCGDFSSNFEELETSDYLKKIKSGTKQKLVKVINISDDINPFWQTIKEQKYVEFINTDLKNSLKLINNNQFLSLKTSDNSVNIETADISIQEKPKSDTSVSNGSNHIYRMYAFGKVLDEQVKIQGDSLAKNDYVSLAKEANIVTPISSLIVLETDEDYKRNGIEKNVDTLGNASISNDGAVPEPYEWVMILIALVSVFFFYGNFKKQTV